MNAQRNCGLNANDSRVRFPDTEQQNNTTMGKFKKWTEADDNTLRDLYQRGIAVSTIAEILNRSERSILWRASQDLKLRRPRKHDRQGKLKRQEYIDCMPNPFEHLHLPNFDKNFYRKI